jgi:uncharacterized glyoxalase superfamily protein PhnB
MNQTVDSVHFATMSAVLPVRDVVETMQYYRDVLGFKIEWLWGEPPQHAAVTKDHVALQFTTWLRDKAEIIPCGWQYIVVSDVDALHDEYSQNGAKIITGLKSQEWGMREFEVEDCNGHILRFGQDTVHEHSQDENGDYEHSHEHGI